MFGLIPHLGGAAHFQALAFPELHYNALLCTSSHSSIHTRPTNLSRQEFPAGAYRTTRLPLSCSVSKPLSWILAPSQLSLAPPFRLASLPPILSVSACRQRCQRGYATQQPACSHLRLMAGQRTEAEARQRPGEPCSHGPVGLPPPRRANRSSAMVGLTRPNFTRHRGKSKISAEDAA